LDVPSFSRHFHDPVERPLRASKIARSSSSAAMLTWGGPTTMLAHSEASNIQAGKSRHNPS
jgi:hypothetical protein